MKLLSLIIAISLFLLQTPLLAQEPAPAGSYGTVRFTITFLGTKHRSDVEAIRSNLIKSPRVKNFTPLSISQMNSRYAGEFEGPEASLVEDVQNLSADRFLVEYTTARPGALDITLKKMKNASSTY